MNIAYSHPSGNSVYMFFYFVSFYVLPAWFLSSQIPLFLSSVFCLVSVSQVGDLLCASQLFIFKSRLLENHPIAPWESCQLVGLLEGDQAGPSCFIGGRLLSVHTDGSLKPACFSRGGASNLPTPTQACKPGRQNAENRVGEESKSPTVQNTANPCLTSSIGSMT